VCAAPASRKFFLDRKLFLGRKMFLDRKWFLDRKFFLDRKLCIDRKLFLGRKLFLDSQLSGHPLEARNGCIVKFVSSLGSLPLIKGYGGLPCWFDLVCATCDRK